MNKESAKTPTCSLKSVTWRDKRVWVAICLPQQGLKINPLGTIDAFCSLDQRAHSHLLAGIKRFQSSPGLSDSDCSCPSQTQTKKKNQRERDTRCCGMASQVFNQHVSHVSHRCCVCHSGINSAPRLIPQMFNCEPGWGEDWFKAIPFWRSSLVCTQVLWRRALSSWRVWSQTRDKTATGCRISFPCLSALRLPPVTTARGKKTHYRTNQ